MRLDITINEDRGTVWNIDRQIDVTAYEVIGEYRQSILTMDELKDFVRLNGFTIEDCGAFVELIKYDEEGYLHECIITKDNWEKLKWVVQRYYSI